MTLKTLTHFDGRTVKMGRRRPAQAYAGRKLEDYLRPDKLVATPHGPLGYGMKAAMVLGEMYGNDTYGDCVIAASMHVEGVLTANAGNEVLYTENDVVKAYEWCGFVPGNESTDRGCEIQRVLHDWIKNGLPGGGGKASAFISVNPASVLEIQTALWLFENLILGMELPDAWVNPMPSASGFLWDVAGAPDPSNGHCVAGLDYSDAGMEIATWGMTGTLTYAAVAEYCSAPNNGELYTVITRDILNRATQRSAEGLDWEALVTDFNVLKKL